MKRKTKVVIAVFLGMVILLLVLAGRYVWMPDSVVKTAIKENELEGIYILCVRERITGFDWRIVSENDLGAKNDLCNISGPSPFDDLDLKHDFVIADNTYIFHVVERNEVYSDELGEMITEYVVSGWDILYPVRHEVIFGLLKSPKYILESDLN